MVENPRAHAQSADAVGNTAGTSCQRNQRGQENRHRGNDVAPPVRPTTKRTSDNRGLNFTASALRRSVTNPSEELSTSFNTAYDGTLKKYHSFVVRPVFSVGTLLVGGVILMVAGDEGMSLSSGFLQEIGTRSDEGGYTDDGMARCFGEDRGGDEDCVCE